MAIRVQSPLLSAGQLSLRARAPVFLAEHVAKFIYVNVDVVAGLIFGERRAIAIENLPPNCGNSNRAKRLRFLVLGVTLERKNLHPPKPAQQDEHARENEPGDDLQLKIVPFELVENKHGATWR